MTSTLDVRLGAQRPRVLSHPPYVSSSGPEVVELAASAGLILDPWQCFDLEVACGERADGKWAAFEVAEMCPRQNGKGGILEARELAGLFLFGEMLILHSAHEFKTAVEAFRRVLGLVENTDDLRRQVKIVRTSHGDEGIELLSGARLRFVARSTGSGRGFSGDLVILDEAYNLSADSMAALLPTLSARPNPQLWYTSSAGMESSEQLTILRERGRRGDDPGLAYMEHSAPPDADVEDRDCWYLANPALGIRISEEFVEREKSALGLREFARERLGIWADAMRDTVIDMGKWAACLDPSAVLGDPLCLGFDVNPERSRGAIGAGGPGASLPVVDAVDCRDGVDWLPGRLLELRDRHKPLVVACDPSGPAGSLLPELERLGIVEKKDSKGNPAPGSLLLLNASAHAKACGLFYDRVVEGRLAHRDQPELVLALDGAKKRPLGEAWAWSRKSSSVDISPLVAVTLALWAHSQAPTPASKYEQETLVAM